MYKYIKLILKTTEDCNNEIYNRIVNKYNKEELRECNKECEELWNMKDGDITSKRYHLKLWKMVEEVTEDMMNEDEEMYDII